VRESQYVKELLLIVDVDDFEERGGMKVVLGGFLDPLGELARVLMKS
jgi:hypothetical protein